MSRQPTPRLKQAGDDARTVARAVNNLLDGKLNSVGDVTLATGTTTTVVANYFAHSGSKILFMPTTANAAAALATTYAAGGTNGFTITHASATTTDRTFGYVLLG